MCEKFWTLPFDETIAAERLPEQVCFAYVDFDFYAPIRAALEKLLPRLSPGQIIVVDDYGGGPRRFTDKQIELLTTFADRAAAIAILVRA